MELEIDIIVNNYIEQTYKIDDIRDLKSEDGTILVSERDMLIHTIRSVAKQASERYNIQDSDVILHFITDKLCDQLIYDINVRDFQFDE